MTHLIFSSFSRFSFYLLKVEIWHFLYFSILGRVVCTFLEKCEIKNSFYMCRRRRLKFRSPYFLRPDFVTQREHKPYSLQTQVRRNVFNVHWSSCTKLLLFLSNFKLIRRCAPVFAEVPVYVPLYVTKILIVAVIFFLRTDRQTSNEINNRFSVTNL
jgi:hypothetical protein